MQARGIKKIILILKIAMTSIKESLCVVLGVAFFKKKRPYTDMVIHRWARKILDLLQVDYQIINEFDFQFDPKTPYVIMSNHASHFDIPLIYTAFPNDSIGMIAKKELFRIPLFGKGMEMGGCVSIDRKDKRQALKDLAHAKDVILSGVRIWIAPEGTRSSTGKMGAFKKGGFKLALDAKAIIVPVTIVGSGKILPTKTLDFSLNEKVKVYIGKQIDSKDYNGDIKKLMTDTIAVIAAKLGSDVVFGIRP